MAIFGLGYNGVKRPLETVIVVPAGSELPTDVADLPGARRRRPARRPRSRPTGPSPRRACADGRPTSSSSPRRTPRRPSAPGQQSTIEVLVDEVDPVAVNYAGFLAAGMSSAINRADHRARRGRGPGLRRGRRRPERRRPSRPTVIAAPTRSEVVNLAPSPAGRAGLLRAGRPGPHPAAPGRDPRRAVARPRAHDRRHRAVPHRPGQHQRGAGRQGPGLRAAGRRHRGAHDGPARRGLRRADARPGGGHRPGHRAAARGLARPRPVHRRRVRLGAPGRAAVAARPPRVGLLQRLRPAHRRVHRARPGARLHAAGDPRHPCSCRT